MAQKRVSLWRPSGMMRCGAVRYGTIWQWRGMVAVNGSPPNNTSIHCMLLLEVVGASNHTELNDYEHHLWARPKLPRGTVVAQR